MTEGHQSRDSLPEIVVDHERPSVDGSTAAAAAQTTTTMTDAVDEWTQKASDVQSPVNDYDYVLHKLHHRQQRPPTATTHVSSVVVVCGTSCIEQSVCCV